MEEITFGSYPQKPDEYENGRRISIVDGKLQSNPLVQQPIEWIVLSEESDSLILLSKYALEYIKFNDWDTFDIAWENCTLRAWMKGMIKYDDKSIKDYFTGEQKSRILPYEETGDVFFLLSLEEVLMFLPSNRERMCAPTAYAASHLPETFKTLRERDTCSWWLRTKSDESDWSTMFVDEKGMYRKNGVKNNMNGVGIRPAVRIRK